MSRVRVHNFSVSLDGFGTVGVEGADLAGADPLLRLVLCASRGRLVPTLVVLGAGDLSGVGVDAGGGRRLGVARGPKPGGAVRARGSQAPRMVLCHPDVPPDARRAPWEAPGSTTPSPATGIPASAQRSWGATSSNRSQADLAGRNGGDGGAKTRRSTRRYSFSPTNPGRRSRWQGGPHSTSSPPAPPRPWRERVRPRAASTCESAAGRRPSDSFSLRA